MNNFLIYILGWILFIIGFYIFNVYIYQSKYSKKLVLYRGFKYGVLSWVGIFGFVIIIIYKYILETIICVDEYIENKLK